MDQIHCQTCNSFFNPNEEQAILIKNSIKKTIVTIILECTLCHKHTLVNLNNPNDSSSKKPADEKNYRCPVSRCSGWVSFITDNDDDDPFWGCGDCGSIWYNNDNFYQEITKIIKMYNYRKKCYLMDKEQYIPAGIEKEEKSYDKLVEKEPKDSNKSYVRG